MAFTENFTPFFSTDEFAEQATLGGLPVKGILEPGFDDAPLAGFGVAGSSPRFTLPASSVPSRSEGLLLIIGSGPSAGSFRVANAMPDGSGLVTLHLIES